MLLYNQGKGNNPKTTETIKEEKTMTNTTVTARQYVDNELRYTEEYTIGTGCDFETVEDLRNALDELIGEAIDSYEIDA